MENKTLLGSHYKDLPNQKKLNAKYKKLGGRKYFNYGDVIKVWKTNNRIYQKCNFGNFNMTFWEKINPNQMKINKLWDHYYKLMDDHDNNFGGKKPHFWETAAGKKLLDEIKLLEK